MVWISSPQSRKGSGVGALIIGILILLFSSLVASLIGVLLSAVVLIISMIILVFGMMMRGSSISLLMIVLGIVGSLIGLSALLSPELAVSVLGILMGLWMILLGMGQLVLASTFSRDRLYHILTILGGALTTFVGLYLVISPIEGMRIMVAFLGCYFIVYGILSLIRPQGPYQNSYVEPN
ncbi:MAG: DUF308 domain-containing protein [Methanobacteriota archaeon]